MEQLNLSLKKYILFLVFFFSSGLTIFAQDAGPDQPNACASTNLAATTAGGIWTTAGGATIVDPTDQNSLVTNLDLGANVFTWTVGAATDDVTITNNEIIADAGPDQPLACASSVLAGSNAAPGTGTWTASAGGVNFDDANSPTANVSNLPIGPTTLTWTIVNGGCTNANDMVITNNTPPVVNAGADDEACTNNSIQLGGNDPSAFGGTGIWSIVTSAGTFADETLYNTWVTGMNPDLNEFQWTVTRNGCSDNDRVIITNNTVVATASDQEVCGTTATLDGNDPAPLGATGNWTVVSSTGSVTTPAQHDSGVTGMNVGVNQFRWDLSKGTCPANTITITITNNAVIANAGPDQPALCSDNTTLAGNTPAGSTGTWSVGGIGSGNITTLTLSNTAVTNLGPDWNEFVWTVTKGICTDNDAVQVQNIVPTPSDAGLPQSVCGTAASLTANAPGPSANFAGIWSVVSGGAIVYVDDTDPTTDIDGLNSGDNILNWRIYSTVDNNCWSDSQVTITNTTLNANAGPDQHVCGTTATMDGSSPGAGTGAWALVSGSGVPTIPTLSNTVVTGLGNGPNTFEWTVTGGTCSGSDRVVIYNDTPSVAAAGADGESCDGTYVLQGNDPVTGTGVWTSAAGPVFANNTVFNTTVSNLNANSNTLTWTITNGSCTDADDVIITNNTITPSNAGPDQPNECKDVFTLAATAPTEGVGQWSVVSGTAIFTNDTQANTQVTSVGRGDNILRWTVTKGTCTASDDVTISNYSVTANAGFDDYTCDATYLLQATDAATQNIISPPIVATGTWTALPAVPAIAFSNIHDNNATVSNLVADGNTLTWTVDNGVCSDADQVVISNDMPTPASVGNDDIFCGIDFDENGEGYTELYDNLQGNTPTKVGETGVWTIVAGGATFVDPTNTPNMRVTNLDHYSQLTGPDYWNQNPTINTFRWTITYKACSLYDEVSIVNAAPFAADAGPDQTVCYDEGNLNAIDHGRGAQTHYWTELNPGNTSIITRSNEFNAYVSELQSNLTTFRWTKSNTLTYAGKTVTCTIYDDTEVTRPNANTARPNAGSNQIVCSEEADMAASPEDIGFPATDNVTGTWSVILGNASFDDLNSHSTHVSNIAYRRNVFRWTVNNITQGCIATDDVDITNALPSNANAGPDQYVCTNTALLSADRPTRGSGEWSVTGGSGVISSTTCQDFSCNTYVSNMGTGQNTFLWTMSNTYTDPASGDTKTCELLDEISVWNNEVTAEAGLDQTVCIDDATLAATQPGTGETGVWSRTGGSGTVTTPSAYNTRVTTLSPNINTFRWRLSNAFCSDEDYMNIINNNPTDPVASTPITNICSDTAPINGNNPPNGVGVWSVKTGGGVIANSLLASTTVTGMPRNTTNTYTWTITKNGCPESADVTIYNYSVTADAGSDIDNVCGVVPAISSTNLAATQDVTPGVSGNWTLVSGAGTVSIDSPTAFNTPVRGMDDGTNTFRWTISNATCSDDDKVNVFVYIPTTAVTNPDREVCADLTDVEVLTANAPAAGRGNGTWTLVSGGGAIDDATANVTNVTNLGKNKNRFRWTIDHNGCTSTNDIILTNNFVFADAGHDQAICAGTAHLNANDPTVNDLVGLAQASGLWAVTQGTGVFVDDTQYDTDVSGLSTAITNILTWTVSKGGCGDFDEVSIINNEFTITAGLDQTVCNVFTNLNGQQPGASQKGVWTVDAGGGSFVNSSLYNTQVNGLVQYPQANTLRWTVTNTTSDNCSATDIMTVYYNKVEAYAGVDGRECSNTTTLNADAPALGLSGNWIVSSGGATVDFPTLYNSTVSNMGIGQNTFTWTVSRTVNGKYCEAVDVVDVYNDTPSDAIVEADKEVCSNSSTLNVVTMPTEGAGIWTAVDNVASIDDISAQNANVAGLNLGINTFRWTVTKNACSKTDDLIITNNAVIADAGIDKSTLCSDQTTLSANDPNLTQGTGVWLDLSGTTATIVDNTAYNTQITGLEQGTTQFQWTVSMGTCPPASSIVRITNNQIKATINTNQVNICGMDAYSPLDGNDVSGIGTGVWTSGNPAITFGNKTVYNTSVANLPTGNNVLTWTVTSDAESCTDDASVTVSNNSVSPNAGADFETCDSDITLGASSPSRGSGVWTASGPTSVTFDDSTDPATGVDGLISGIYIFRWTLDYNGCSDYDEVQVTNNTPSPAAANTLTPGICNNASPQLIANPLAAGETGLWTKVGSSGGTIDDATSNNTFVTALPLGANTYRWTLSKGNSVVCHTQAEVTINNNTVVAEAGNPQNVCSTTANLIGNNPNDTQGNGLWSGGAPATIATPSLYNSGISGIPDNTTLTFTWTVSKGGCSEFDNVNITNGMVLANAGSDDATCFDHYTLDGNDVSATGAAGLWTKQTGSPASFVHDTQYNTQVNSLAPGINIFTWTVTSASSCVDPDDVSITYNQVVANAGLDQELCNSSTSLAAIVSPTGSGYWQQTSGSPTLGLTDSTDPNATISGMVGGNYTFKWTFSNNGCSDDDEVLIINSSPKPATANAGVESCDGTGLLSGNAPAAQETGLWVKVDAGGTITNASLENATVSGMKQGDNVYKWTLSKGNTITCVSEATVTIPNNQLFTVVATSGTGQNTTCDGTISLSGTNPADENADRGEWVVNTGANIANNTLYQTTASNLALLANDFTWTLYKGGCPGKSSNLLTINNNSASAQITSPTGSNKEVCDGIVNLTATSSTGSGVWSLVSGSGKIQNSLNTATTVTGLEKNNNIFRWTVDNGTCTAIDEITIVNNQVFPQANNKNVCEDSTRLPGVDPDIVDNSIDAHYWVNSGGTAAIIQTSTEYNSWVSNLAPNVNSFRWYLEKGTCKDYKEIQVVNQGVVASANDVATCTIPVTLDGSPPPAGANGLWSHVAGTYTFVDDNTLYNARITNIPNGNSASLVWTVTKGICSDATDPITVTNNNFALSAGNDAATCAGEIQLNGQDISGGTGFWKKMSGNAIFDNSTVRNTWARSLANNDNVLRWTVDNGNCENHADVTISNNQVVAQLSATSMVICGSSATLNAINPAPHTGTWSSLDGTANPPTVVTPSAYNSLVTGLKPGSNQFKWHVVGNGGCNDDAFLSIVNDTVILASTVETTEICADETDLWANDPSPNSGVWTSPIGQSAIIDNTTQHDTHISGLGQGTNTFYWTVTSANAGCTTTQQFDVTNNLPTVANAGSDAPNHCFDFYQLNGNNPLIGTGKWSLVSGNGAFDANTLRNTYVRNLQAGTNEFKWTITSSADNTCFTESNVIITSNAIQANAGLDQLNLCSDSTDLNANLNKPATESGYWKLIGGNALIDKSLLATTKVTGLGKGNNTFRWHVSNLAGCKDADDVLVVNNIPAKPSTDPDINDCFFSYSVSATAPPSGGTGLWTRLAGSGTFDNPTNYNPVVISGVSNQITNQFEWTVTTNGCSNSDTITIINNGVSANADPDAFTCDNFYTLRAAVPDAGTGVWTVESGNGIVDKSLNNNTLVTNLDQGNNGFRWTVTRGSCSDFDDVNIINNAPTTADAGSAINTCDASESLLANNPTEGTGLWTKPVGSTAIIATPSLYNTAITIPVKANPYSEQFTWTITKPDGNGGVCSSESLVTVAQNSFINFADADNYTCDGTYALTGRNPANVSATATGLWSVAAGSGTFDNSLNYNATVSGLNAAANTLQWTITNVVAGGTDCSVPEDVVITNDQVVAQVNSGAGMTCDNYQVLSANNPALLGATGVWTVNNPNGQYFDNSTSNNTVVHNLTSGNNELTWTVTKNACSESTVIDVEYYIPNANITVSDIVHSCNDVTALTADPVPATGNGIWSLKFGSPTVTIDNNSLANTTARNLEIGDNIFVWTINDRGCTSTDEVSINNSMPVNTDGFDQAACSNTFNMNAQVPTATGSGLWTVVSSSGTVVFADNTLATTQVTVPYGNNILKWTIADNGCTAEKTFNIDNNLTNPIASDGDTVKVCRDEVQLSGSQPATGETGVWSIDGSAGSEVFDNASIYNPIVTNLRKGQITFRWTVSNANCTDYDLAVVVNNTPFVDAGTDRTICENNINLAGNIPAAGESGLWTIGSTVVVIDNDTKYNTHVSSLGNTNTFTWTIDNGLCTNFDEVVITSRSIDVSAGLAYQEACADTLSLEATNPADVGSGTGVGTWSAIEGSGTFDDASSYLTIGRNLRDYNKLRWTIVDSGCTYSDDIEFVSLLPTAASTGVDKAVCDNFTQITGQQPDYTLGETGLWTVASGTASITEATAFQTQVTGLNLGTNIFKWTISNASCSDADLIVITNNQVFADAGTDQPAVCDSSATISANVISGTGYWMTTSPTAIIENSLAATTNVTQLSFGANNFQWIITNNGCTKVDEVTVTSILPRDVSAGANQDVCTGTTNLAGSNAGIGSGLWTLTGGAGSFADKTANQTTVSGLASGDNLFTWTVTVNGCSENSQVRISNNSIDVSAGTNQTICNLSSTTLDGTIPGSGVTGTWSVQGGSGTFVNNSVYNTDVSGFTKGTNSYRWTLDDGNCINYADVVVTNNTPDPASVGPDQTNLCVDYTTISAIPVSVGTGKWTVSSGNGTIVNPTSNNTDVEGINKGANTFTWTVTKNGCSLADDIVVTNNSVDAYIADKNVVICTPTHTATIIGNAPATGQTGFWSKQNAADAGIIVSSASNVTNVTNLDNGDTYFTWTIQNGLCSNSDDVRVTNNYYNTTANPAGPNTLCEDYSPILGGSPPAGGSGLWTSTAPDVTFDDDTKVSTVARNLPGGTTAITWTVTKDGCSAPASFNLVNNAIYTSAGENQIVCQTSTNMNAQALLVGETGQWVVDNALVVITDTSDPTTAVSNLIPGNNTFTWTLSSNGCTASDVVVVSDNSFSVTAGNDDIACGTSYNLAASDPLSGTGLWTVSSGTGRFVNASNYQTTVLDMDNGANTFTWTVQRNGCEDADDVAITNNLYLAVAGEDRPICSTQTTVSAQPLNPTWGASGLWTAQTGGGVFANPSSESTLVSGLASGDNRLRWTITKTESGTTCTSYDEIVITNNSITSAAGTDETTCDNFATLSATPLSPTGTGLWSGGGVYTVIVEPSSATTLVTDLQQGTNTFAWTVSDKGCNGTSTVKVTSNYFVADAGASQVVTVNSAVMSATLPDATATGAWTTFSGSGSFADPTDPAETVTALGFGINTFRWTVSWSSCTAHDDVDITYNAISADAGPQQVICKDETYLAANNPAPGTGKWSLVSGSAAFDNIDDPNTRVSGIQPGSINIFRWTVEIGGYSEYDDVTVLNSEFTISAGSDKEECYNSSTMTAEGAGAGTGTWSVLSGGGNFVDNTLNNTGVTNIAEGKNLFVWRVVKNTGCVNSDTVQVTYNLPPTAGFDMDQSAGCTPIDVTFTNTSVNGKTYYWNFGDDFRTDSSLISFTRTYEALYDKDSTYDVQLVAESAKGCYDTLVQQVTTYRIPLVGFSAAPTSQLFPRSEITIENLSGNGYANYYWDMDDGNTYLQNSMVESFSHKYDTWGEYTITLSVFSDNCSDTARQTITIVAPQPVTTIKPGLRAKGCEDLSVYFEAFVNYADTFHWDFGDGGTSEEQDPTYIYDTPGTYIVTLSANGPGTDSLIVVRRDTVKVFEVPTADFEAIPDTVMLPNQPVILHNNSISADKYQWDFGSGESVDTTRSPTHYYTEEGIFTITLDVWTNNGCHDSKAIENAVVVEPAGTFQFPSAINPYSKTEINREFKPKHRGIREYKLEIYNRWGEKIFESTDPDVGWKGYIDGKVGAQDVYVWKVSGKYKNGILFTKTGDVTLIR